MYKSISLNDLGILFRKVSFNRKDNFIDNSQETVTIKMLTKWLGKLILGLTEDMLSWSGKVFFNLFHGRMTELEGSCYIYLLLVESNLMTYTTYNLSLVFDSQSINN